MHPMINRANEISESQMRSEYATPSGLLLFANSFIMSENVSAAELDSIFGNSKSSARELRHSIVHDIGPSNIKNVRAHCASHIPTMQRFLDCIAEFHEYQRKKF